MERALAEKLWTLLDPVVTQQGYEIIELEVHGNRNSVLRIFLDGKDGIGVDKCAEFSRLFSAVLDVEDPFKTKYTLEVSSPGFDRPLRKPQHFAKQLGQNVAVKIALPGGQVKKARGKLVAVDDAGISFTEANGTQHKVSHRDLIAAQLLYDFSAEDAARVAFAPKDKPKKKKRK